MKTFKCICGKNMRFYAGSSSYSKRIPNAEPDERGCYPCERIPMRSCSLRCTDWKKDGIHINVPRGKWFPTHEEAKEDTIKRYEKIKRKMK